MEASRLNEKVGGGYIAPVTAKFRGQQDVSVVHPRLVVAVARILIQQKVELSPAFMHLLNLSQQQIEKSIR